MEDTFATWVNDDILVPWFWWVLLKYCMSWIVLYATFISYNQFISIQFYMARKSFTFNMCMILLFQLDVPIEFPFPHIKSTSHAVSFITILSAVIGLFPLLKHELIYFLSFISVSARHYSALIILFNGWSSYWEIKYTI